MTGWHRIERGTGRPLVLLHGGGVSAKCWLPVLDRLGATRRAIAFDLPGFGETPMTDRVRFEAEWTVDELAGELRRIGVDGPVDMAGNSMGGFVALEAAKRGLARSVVALAPAGLWHRGMPLPLRIFFETALSGALLTRIGSQGVFNSAAARRAAFSLAMAHPERMTAGEAWSFVRDFDRSAPTLRRVLKLADTGNFAGGQSISVPVTIAFGTEDRILRAGTSRCRDELPVQTRWLTLPGCGHVPMWDAPELVARTVLDGTATNDHPGAVTP